MRTSDGIRLVSLAIGFGLSYYLFDPFDLTEEYSAKQYVTFFVAGIFFSAVAFNAGIKAALPHKALDYIDDRHERIDRPDGR
jgi:hypothetical protein